jgi:hypothetical protein
MLTKNYVYLTPTLACSRAAFGCVLCCIICSHFTLACCVGLQELNFDNCSPWMLRLVLDRKKKEDKGLTNAEIARQIQHDFGGDLLVIFNNDNAPTLVLQVRISGDTRKGEAGADQLDENAVPTLPLSSPCPCHLFCAHASYVIFVCRMRTCS